MIQKKILLLIVLVGFLSFSQDDTGTPGEEKDVNLFSFPVSPEAGRLGTYGNVPVNLSTGQINFQVPLHTIDARGYSWPISLSYNFKGLVYEEGPSLTGLGWLLNAGGVVTREVRGIPDEHPNGYYGAQNLKDIYLNPYFSSGDISRGTANQLVSGNIDGEADKYYVSVNGISFSFKVGLDKQPVFISEHNYQLQFEWKNDYELDGFIVTDDNGIKYFFSEKEYNSPTNIGANFNVFNDSFREYVSSWNLSNVIFPNGEELSFSYTTRQYYSYNFFASGHTNSQVITCGFAQPTDLYNYSNGFSKTLITQNILSQITSSSVNVSFNYAPIPDNTSSQNITYSSIGIRNKYDNSMLWTYDLTYQGSRDMLMQINRNNEKYYAFDYHNKSNVPGFVNSENDNPFKQDYWGFYNGINNQYGVTMAGTPYEADKRPNFHHTSAGALHKITYPTGGFSTINYEQNSIKELYQNILNASQNFAPNWQIHLEQETRKEDNSSGYIEKKYQYTFNDTVVANIKYDLKALPASRSGVSIVKLNGCTGVTNSASEIGEFANHLRAITGDPIPELCPRVYAVVDDGDIEGGPNDPVNKRGSTNGKIKIEPGTYEFKIWTSSSHEDTYGELLMKFYLPVGSGSDDTEVSYYDNYLVGGIRISELTNYTAEGKVTDTKNYEYIDDSGFSSGKELQKAITKYTHIVENCCGLGGVPDETRLEQFYRTNYTLKTHNSVNLNQGVPVIYTKVRESKEKRIRTTYTGLPDCNTPECLVPAGTNGGILTYIGSDTNGIYNTQVKPYYPQGYTETSFDYDQIEDPTVYPFVPEGVDKDMGRIKNQNVLKFEEKDFQYSMISSQNTDYVSIRNEQDENGFDNNANHPMGVKAAYRIKKEGGCTIYLENETVLDYFSLVKYAELDTRYLQSIIVSKEYFPQEVSTTQNLSYDTKHQLKKTTTTNSENEVIETENFYPYDMITGSASDMASENILTPVVASKTKREGIIIGQSKLEYTEILPTTNNAPTIYKPSKKLIAVGNESLRGVTKYDQYDTKGNLLQYFNIIKDGTASNSPDPNPVADEGGVITSAIWGYNHTYPVAKIVNASYDEVVLHLSVTIDQLQNLDGEQLRNELDAIRQALPKAQVTTYTYRPLVGVTSITDPRGYTIFYEYDGLYRLQFARDNDGNILTENQYNYRD